MEHKVNINDTATVVLTESGANIINNHIKEQKCFLNDKQIEILFGKVIFESGDKYRCQLWEIMSIFGSHIFMGCDIPFVNNEIIFD